MVSASIHLEKYSTATNNNFFCALAGRNGPTMSIPQRAKGQDMCIEVNFAGVVVTVRMTNEQHSNARRPKRLLP